MVKQNRLGCSSFLNNKDKKIMEEYYEKALESDYMDKLDRYWISLLELGSSMEIELKFHKIKDIFIEKIFPKIFLNFNRNKNFINIEILNEFLKNIINKKYERHSLASYNIDEIKKIFFEKTIYELFNIENKIIYINEYEYLLLEDFLEELYEI